MKNHKTARNDTNSIKKNSGMGIKTRILNPRDAFWDFRMGTQTFGFKPSHGESNTPDFRVHYTPTPYKKLFNIMNRMDINSSDKFLDIGCGLGRAVFVASWLGAKQSVGVDIDDELITAANETYKKSRLTNRDIQFICSSAETFSPLNATIIYMFHPFGQGTLQKVIDTLEQEIERQPRKVRIAYENPVHASTIDKSSNFRRIDEWPEKRISGSHYSVVFWETNLKINK